MSPTSRGDHGYLRRPVLPVWKQKWIYTQCIEAQAVYFVVADVAFCVDDQDGAGYRRRPVCYIEYLLEFQI